VPRLSRRSTKDVWNPEKLRLRIQQRKAKIYLEQSLSLLDYVIQLIYKFGRELIEHLAEEWKAIQGRHDALDFWNAIVATHNAVSTGKNDMNRIKTRRQ